MEKNTLATVHDLNCALRDNSYWARGTNYPVEHLPATGATSRWEHENIYGIYMTVPNQSWMALWMGATKRRQVRKRHLWYVRPDTKANDYIGKIRIYEPNEIPDENIFCKEHGAYLYLVNPERFKDCEKLDLKGTDNSEKIKRLSSHGFLAKKVWCTDSVLKTNYYHKNHGKPGSCVVEADDWQIALVNVPRVMPDVELFITPDVVNELAKTRTSRSAEEPGEKYILNSDK